MWIERKMKLILGKDGFIGKNIDGDLKVGKTDCDLTNQEALTLLFKKLKPTTVVNCSGKHGSFQQMQGNHIDFLLNNLRIDMNVLEAAQKCDVENVLLLSSITSFPPDSFNASTASELSNETLAVDMRFYGYAMAKKIQPKLVKSFQLDYNLNYKSVYLANIYGPFDNFSETGTAIPKIIHKIQTAMEMGESSVIFFVNGLSKRNRTFSGDLNKVFEAIISDKHLKEPIIVSTDETHHLRKIAETVKHFLGFQGKIIFEDADKTMSDNKIVSNKKLIERYDNFNFTPIEEGLEKTVKSLFSRE
jgi:GDP-L-fucose synthase